MKRDLKEIISEYASLAEEHSFLNSFDEKEVKKANSIAKKILNAADLIDVLNGSSEFEKLLEHKNSGVRSWVVFNLIERMNSNEKQVEKALSVIEKIAKSDSLDSAGAQLWLENWMKR